jgi:hypothetical protein
MIGQPLIFLNNKISGNGKCNLGKGFEHSRIDLDIEIRNYIIFCQTDESKTKRGIHFIIAVVVVVVVVDGVDVVVVVTAAAAVVVVESSAAEYQNGGKDHYSLFLAKMWTEKKLAASRKEQKKSGETKSTHGKLVNPMVRLIRLGFKRYVVRNPLYVIVLHVYKRIRRLEHFVFPDFTSEKLISACST